MKRLVVAGLFCAYAVLSGECQVFLEDFFTPDGGSSPISLNGGQKCGQRFTATMDFEGIEVNGPTWSVSGEKGMTIRLYNWAGSYSATVAQEPIVTRVLVDLDDNGWFPCYAPRSLPPGQYFWEASEPTNSNPDAVDPYQIGCWLYNSSTYTGGEAYFNGVPYEEAAVSWTRWYSDGQSGTWHPFDFPTTENPTLSQSFETDTEINAVGIASPTWNGTGAGYRMSLYKWDTDFDKTVAKAPLAQKSFSNISDNARNEMLLSTPQPAGRYLVVTDMPVRGTGNVGHWGWQMSDYADENNVFYIDGVETEDFSSMDLFVGFPAAQPVGKDFASRSVTEAITPVSEWGLY